MNYIHCDGHDIAVGLDWKIKPHSKSSKEFINESFPHPIGWGAVIDNNIDYELGTIEEPDKQTKKSLVGALIVSESFDENITYCKIEDEFAWIVHIQNGLVSSKSDNIIRADDIELSISNLQSQYGARIVLSEEPEDVRVSFEYDVISLEDILNGVGKLKRFHPKQLKSQNNLAGLIFLLVVLALLAGVGYYVYKEFFSTKEVPVSQNFEQVYDANSPELKAEAKRRIEEAVKNSYISNFATPQPYDFILNCIRSIQAQDKVVAGWKIKEFKCLANKITASFEKIHISKSTYKEFHKYYPDANFAIDGINISVDLPYIKEHENRFVEGPFALPHKSDVYLNYISLFQTERNNNQSFAWNAKDLTTELITYLDPYLEKTEGKDQARTSVPTEFLYKYSTVVFKDVGATNLDELALDDTNAVIDFSKPPFFKVAKNFVSTYEISIKYYVK